MMSEIFIKFFYPYALLLNGAAYNVQQTIEGAGLGTSNFALKDSAGIIVGSYLSPGDAMLFPLGMLAMYCLVLSLGFGVAGYAIARKKGVIISFLTVSSPGFISLFGYWPTLNFMPETFHIGGTGALGSPYGMAVLAIIAASSGWVFIIIATDILNLQDKFRHFYDHFWYSLAIVAGLFYVADTSTFQDTRDVQDTIKNIQQASSYLRGQLKEYSRVCKLTATEQMASCIWANNIQQNLLEYTAMNERLYLQSGPKSEKELYALFGTESKENESKIREEIEQFNLLQCPVYPNRVTRPSDTCQSPPAQFCTGASNGDYLVRTVVVPNECVVPTLVRLRRTMEKQVISLNSAARSKHFRWLFYIFCAVLAGGKVANATAKLTKAGAGEKGLGEENNTIILLLAVWRGIQFLGRKIYKISNKAAYFIKQLFISIFSILNFSFKKMLTRFTKKIREDE